MNRQVRLLLAIFIFLAFGSAHSDALRDANRLLEVSNTGDHFNAVAAKQAGDIIRSYMIIVRRSTEITLPLALRQDLASCYSEVYAWDNFQDGIARLLSQTLDEQQMQLLIDFYRSRGLPPWEIERFKQTIALADNFARISADFIYENSASCVERDARVIRSYLHRHPDLEPLDRHGTAD